jgi:hypothetical protein
VAVGRCPTHGRVEVDDPEAPTCPVLSLRTIAGEAIAEPCGMRLEPVDDDEE